ncbi:MAG: hypothetical protein PUC72_02940 [Bacteroidales bacterium]|nr:hypothetical protein [Bacteroidales bacterium]
MINTKGEQFLSEIPEGQDFIGSRPELLGYTNVGMDELSLITIVDSLCYYRFNRNGPKQFVVMLEDSSGLPGIIDKNGFDGWDASFSLLFLQPITYTFGLDDSRAIPMIIRIRIEESMMPRLKNGILDSLVLPNISLKDYYDYYKIEVGSESYLVPNCYWLADDDILYEPIRMDVDVPFITEETDYYIQDHRVQRITNPEEYTYEMKFDRTDGMLYKGVLHGKIKTNERDDKD